MRLPLLLALTAVGACATTSPTTETAPSVPQAAGTAVSTPTADVAVVREPGGGAVVFVSFRTEAAVTISPGHPLRVKTSGGTFEAPLEGGPQRSAEGAATVSSAEYRVDEAGATALDYAGNGAQVLVHDGRAYRTYQVRRTDLLE
ncbi:MAG TPA: hypothetical protein VF576_11445 [Rubricoccaceae bacterium]|jgi:hypothetical protein